MEKSSEIILSELKDYIKNETSLANGSALPVGFVYVQFPNCLAPSNLGLIGTWSQLLPS